MKKAYSTYVMAMLGVILALGLGVAGCDDGNEDNGDRVTLTAGEAVGALATDTTANVTFTGATGVTGLSTADFTVTGGTFTSADVTSDTVTVVVGFDVNTDETTTKIITVAVKESSTKIKGGASVAITQAAAGSDPRAILTAGEAVDALAADTTANVTFTGATGVTGLTTADFTVTGGAFTSADVNGDTATVVVGFDANATAAEKTITVAVKESSTKIKGNASVTITQAAASDTRATLTAGNAVDAEAADTTAQVTFTGATGVTGLTTADFTVTNGTFTSADVSGDAATVVVGFAVNTDETTAKTITVAVKESSTKIKGSASVTITQAAAGQGVSLAELEDYLAALSTNIAANPHTVILAASVAINTADTDANGVWATINSTVLAAGKYVLLDISACSAVNGETANAIAGAQTPTNNHFNIIKANTYIKGVTLPDTLTSIGNYAFQNCTSLTSVTIPASVTSIGFSAFSICTNLTNVTIPANVTSIGTYAFSRCDGFTAFIVADGNTAYSVQDGILYNKTKKTLICVPIRKSGALNNLPDTLTSIESQAFYCSYLTSVTIPANVTTIGISAFSLCSTLTSVTIGAGVTTIGTSAFYNCSRLTSVTIPAGVTTIGDSAFSYCSKLATVVFEGSSAAISNVNSFPSATSGISLKTAYETGKTNSNKGVAGTYTRTPATSPTDGSWSR